MNDAHDRIVNFDVAGYVADRIADCALLWAAGKNTAEIAEAIGLARFDQWAVHNALPAIRARAELRRAA